MEHEAFALDELYRHHKDVAYEIVCRARANEAGYLKEIIQVYSEWGLMLILSIGLILVPRFIHREYALKYPFYYLGEKRNP